MQFTKLKKPVTLSVLFFLPVTFLLFLYPSKHNYVALDIVQENIIEVTKSPDQKLEDHITILTFYGSNPDKKAISALNLKELIYDKFKGFKRFQVVSLVGEDSQDQVTLLKKELFQYEPLEYWHFVHLSESEITNIFNSLNSETSLDSSSATDHVFIVDKERNQRGRLDDREKHEIEKGEPLFGMPTYNCIEVAELKNKMSEDMRILFTEYRQKRKGNFDSSTRRADDLLNDEKN